MADNLVANAGAGGGTLRFLQDAGGVDWGPAVVTYATTLVDGANVLQVVTPGAPLPVTGAVTQSGTWNVGSITTLPALAAGAAIIGKVGIDQTTVGTTNAVSLAQIGATTIATGNGVVGAGVQRVSIASDTTMPPPADATASGNITTQNLVPAGAATAGSAVEISLSGQNSLSIQAVGTYTGALSVQGTIDGTNWVTLTGSGIIYANGSQSSTITSATQSLFSVNVTGFAKARVTGLAAMTGTVTVTLRASAAASTLLLSQNGNATIGSVAVIASASLIGDAGIQYRAIHSFEGKATAMIKQAVSYSYIFEAPICFRPDHRKSKGLSYTRCPK